MNMNASGVKNKSASRRIEEEAAVVLPLGKLHQLFISLFCMDIDNYLALLTIIMA